MIANGPYGSYTTPSSTNNSARTALNTNLNNLLKLIPNPASDPAVAVNYAPDFDRIHPATAYKIRTEIQAIITGLMCTANITATGDI